MKKLYLLFGLLLIVFCFGGCAEHIPKDYCPKAQVEETVENFDDLINNFSYEYHGMLTSGFYSPHYEHMHATLLNLINLEVPPCMFRAKSYLFHFFFYDLMIIVEIANNDALNAEPYSQMAEYDLVMYEEEIERIHSCCPMCKVDYETLEFDYYTLLKSEFNTLPESIK